MKRIALYGLVLNTLWEFGQCLVLYDMWAWSFWKSTVWMWGAIAGDVLIVLGVSFLARRAVGWDRLRPPTRAGWAALLGIGLLAGILLEWLALALDLWHYSPFMPTLTLFDQAVGLSPILQVTLLPALSVYLAARSLTRDPSSALPGRRSNPPHHTPEP